MDLEIYLVKHVTWTVKLYQFVKPCRHLNSVTDAAHNIASGLQPSLHYKCCALQEKKAKSMLDLQSTSRIGDWTRHFALRRELALT